MTDLYMIVRYVAQLPIPFKKQLHANLVNARLNWVTLGEL